MKRLLKSYFYWTYERGSFHYDVMVTAILAFIFITPQIPGWDYGDKPSNATGLTHPIQIIGNDGHGLIITVMASDVNVPTNSSDAAMKKALRKAIEPVTGDSVFVEHWELSRDASGNPVAWKIWAHR
jgi:hypothetical protein